MATEHTPESVHIPQSPAERLEAVRAEMRELGAGQAPDVYMQAFYQRCDIEFDTNPTFRQVVLQYLEQVPSDEPTHAANKIFRAVQFEVIPEDPAEQNEAYDNGFRDPNYPHGRDVPSGWDDAFEAIQTPVGHLLFKQNLILNRLQSNVAWRGSLLRATAQLYGILKAKIYSGGCSAGEVEKLMVLFDDDKFTYPDVTVGAHVSGQSESEERPILPDPQLTEEYNRLVRNRKFKVSRILGVDLLPPNNPEARSWIRSCSLRPSEFEDQANRTLEHQLATAELPNMEFYGASFTKPEHPQQLRRNYPRWRRDRFNMAVFSMSLYQCKEEERDQAVEVANELTSDDAIIVIFDVVQLDPNQKMHFASKWRDWDFNVYVLDKSKPDAGLQHVFNVREGRAREVIPGADLRRKLAEHAGHLAIGMMRD